MRSPFSFLSSLVFLFRWRKKKTGNSTLNGPPITKIRFNTDQFKLRLLLETRVLNFIFITSLDEIGQFFIPSLLLFRTQIASKAEGDRQRRREKREEERREKKREEERRDETQESGTYQRRQGHSVDPTSLFLPPPRHVTLNSTKGPSG